MGRLMYCLVLVVVSLVSWSPVIAAELTPLRREQRIGARLQFLDYPTSLRKDLVSGLTNRLLIRISLQRESSLLAEAALEVSVRYDLWDEVFEVTMTTPLGGTTRTEPSLEAVLRSLHDLRLQDALAAPQVRDDELLVMHVDVLLNPIDRERMDKIRQWVAHNTTAAADDAGRRTRTTTAASQLFARIFEQYAAGKDVAATWSRSLSSAPFRFSELSNDAR